MTTTTHPAAAEYVARIQAALADLPSTEVEEIVDDIRQHLSEVADELGEEISVEALTERLGTPEQYASELRAAAGYPPASAHPAGRPGIFTARFALWALVLGLVVALVAGIVSGAMEDANAYGGLLLFSVPLLIAIALVFSGAAPISTVVKLREHRAVADAWRRMMSALPEQVSTYLRSLRPAWWLIRILILIAALLVASQRAGTGEFVPLTLVAIAVLLWFGKRARTDRRWSWIIAPANVFVVGVGLALLGTAWDNEPGGAYPVFYTPPGLYGDGRYLDNVYVFGPDGKPLPEAYLYDENGQPIRVPGRSCAQDSMPTNKFPQPKLEYRDGRCEEITGVPFTVVLPQPSTPSTSSTPPSTPSTPPTK